MAFGLSMPYHGPGKGRYCVDQLTYIYQILEGVVIAYTVGQI